MRSIELEDGILESTTLYGVSFQVSDDHFIGSSPSSKSPAEEGNAKEQKLLEKFVTANFDKFISHVRMLLIQQSEPSSDFGPNENDKDGHIPTCKQQQERKTTKKNQRMTSTFSKYLLLSPISSGRYESWPPVSHFQRWDWM